MRWSVPKRVAGECRLFHTVSLPTVAAQFRDSRSFGRAAVGNVLRITI